MNNSYNLGFESASIGVKFHTNPYYSDFQHDDWLMWNIGWFAYHSNVEFENE